MKPVSFPAQLTVCLLVLALCGVAYSALTCWGDPDKCAEDECCVRMTNFVGACRKMKAEGEGCNMKDLKQPLRDHVHLMQCPCLEGLKCVKKEGIIGVARGTCEAGSGEQPEE